MRFVDFQFTCNALAA